MKKTWLIIACAILLVGIISFSFAKSEAVESTPSLCRWENFNQEVDLRVYEADYWYPYVFVFPSETPYSVMSVSRITAVIKCSGAAPCSYYINDVLCAVQNTSVGSSLLNFNCVAAIRPGLNYLKAQDSAGAKSAEVHSLLIVGKVKPSNC